MLKHFKNETNNTIKTVTMFAPLILLMTAFSFILGVLPLVFATGAGAGSRVSLGITVLAGMIAATLFGTLLVPYFYLLIQRMREKFKGKPEIT